MEPGFEFDLAVVGSGGAAMAAAITARQAGRTVLMISHRSAALRVADVRLALRGGRLCSMPRVRAKGVRR